MSLICLVHGSTQDARCWELLAPELKKLGHSILHPQLPTDEPEAGSSRYADVILQSLPADARKVTLVAHSASGYFLPLVAAQRRLRCLVFLAATLPQLGMSFLDQLLAGPAMFCPDWAGKDPGQDDAAALHFLFHDCSPEVARWAMTTRIRLPLQKVATEIYPLDRWPKVASSYIVCAQDRTLSPQWSRWVARERLGSPSRFPPATVHTSPGPWNWPECSPPWPRPADLLPIVHLGEGKIASSLVQTFAAATCDVSATTGPKPLTPQRLATLAAGSARAPLVGWGGYRAAFSTSNSR